MTTEADLRELSEKATPGRWRYVGRPKMLTAYIQSQHVRHPNANGSWADVASAVANNYDNEANAAFIVACVNYVRDMLASQDHAPSAGAVQVTTDPADVAERLKDAERFQYLLDHHAYHYAMTVVEPSPAEWGIEWQYQQTKPGEERLSFRDLIDRDIQWRAEQDAASPPPPEGER